MQDPPFRGENLLSASDYGRGRRFRAQSRLGCPSRFTRRQEGFIMHFRDNASDSRSGLIIADFTILFASLVAALEYGDFVKVIGISCRDALPVWWDYGLVFSRRAGSRLV